jgi:hypothetical protein
LNDQTNPLTNNDKVQTDKNTNIQINNKTETIQEEDDEDEQVCIFSYFNKNLFFVFIYIKG